MLEGVNRRDLEDQRSLIRNSHWKTGMDFDPRQRAKRKKAEQMVQPFAVNTGCHVMDG
jgi:hypothetical protein